MREEKLNFFSEISSDCGRTFGTLGRNETLLPIAPLFGDGATRFGLRLRWKPWEEIGYGINASRRGNSLLELNS